jgi:hypothetical protein
MKRYILSPSQSKDYRLVLVRLVEALLKPALALIYIVYNDVM